MMLHENEDFLMLPELLLCKIPPIMEFCDEIGKRVKFLERRMDES